MHRRDFLTVAAGTAALGAMSWGSVGQGAERKRRKFTLDLRCGAIGVSADLRKSIAYAHQFGFESVEPPGEAVARLSQSELDEVLAEMKAKNLVWGAAGMPVNFRADEAAFKEGMQSLPALAAGLRKAGITRMSTWLSPASDKLTYVANFRQHARRLGEVSKVLGDHGLRFGMEYVGPMTSWTKGRYPFLHTMAELKDLIAEMKVDNAGFVLDSWHWYTAGDTVEDLLSLKNHDVVACDLNDAPAGIERNQQLDNQRELPAATGVIDLKAFLGALVEIGYDGPIRAEPFNKALNEMGNEEALETTAKAMRKAFALVE
ncbi:MAG: sugar phosphate isomerase/epimerase family protein [Thermoguttaceae bacterium]